jgi:hypothetical protein
VRHSLRQAISLLLQRSATRLDVPRRLLHLAQAQLRAGFCLLRSQIFRDEGLRDPLGELRGVSWIVPGDAESEDVRVGNQLGIDGAGDRLRRDFELQLLDDDLTERAAA